MASRIDTQATPCPECEYLRQRKVEEFKNALRISKERDAARYERDQFSRKIDELLVRLDAATCERDRYKAAAEAFYDQLPVGWKHNPALAEHMALMEENGGEQNG